MTASYGLADRTTLLALTSNLDIGDVADPALRLSYFQYMTDLADAMYVGIQSQFASKIASGLLSELGAFNVKSYNASGSALAFSGNMTTGLKVVTLIGPVNFDFVVGQGINIAGAGVAGATLETTIASLNGTVITTVDAANTTVAAVAVRHNDTTAINAAMAAANANGGGTVIAPVGTYNINPVTGITLYNKIKFQFPGATIQAIGSSNGTYQMLKINDCTDVTIEGGTILGERYSHMDANGVVWSKWHALTAYAVGDIVYVNEVGYKCTTAGTSSSTAPSHTSGSAVDGTVTWLYYIANVGEFGHCISVRGSSRVHIRGVVAKFAWGDGLLVSKSSTGGTTYSQDVSLYRNTFDNNRRQGISVGGVKGFYIDKNRTTNTDGTRPSAGIDFENDSPDMLLQDIWVNDHYSEGNDGSGIKIYLAQSDATSGHINIIINNHVDYGSYHGFQAGGGSAILPGIIRNTGAYYQNSQYGGIHIEDHGYQMPRIELIRYKIVDCNTSGSVVSRLYSSGIGIMRAAASGNTAVSIGNVHMYDGSIEDNRATKLMLEGLYIQDAKSESVEEISLIDPVRLDYGTNTSRIAIRANNLKIRDKHRILSRIITTNETFDRNNIASYITNDTIAGTRALTFGTIPIGTEFTYVVTKNQILQLKPQGTETILPFCALGKYLAGPITLGASVTLRKDSATQWTVTNIVGTWTPEP